LESKLIQQAKKEDLELNSRTAKGFAELVRAGRAQERADQNFNSHVDPLPPSRSTMTRLRKRIVPDSVEAGVFKTSTRARAIMEVQNPITCASVVFHMQNVLPEVFLSLDNVGVEIGDKMGECVLILVIPR
jgi:hypothetical protein